MPVAPAEIRRGRRRATCARPPETEPRFDTSKQALDTSKASDPSSSRTLARGRRQKTRPGVVSPDASAGTRGCWIRSSSRQSKKHPQPFARCVSLETQRPSNRRDVANRAPAQGWPGDPRASAAAALRSVIRPSANVPSRPHLLAFKADFVLPQIACRSSSIQERGHCRCIVFHAAGRRGPRRDRNGLRRASHGTRGINR